MNANLKSKTLQALFWSFLERFGQQGIQFIIGIILARLLLPEDFGLIAMLTIFISIAHLFIDSGFGNALIQKKNTRYIDECSIFYFNIFLGCFSTFLLCLGAPWIAVFYNQPILKPLIYALSLNLIISALCLIQTTLLRKRVDFKTLLKISLIASIVSGAIGIIMALNGFGVWSLVTQSLSSNILRTALMWLFNSWRPSLAFSFISLRDMLSFSSRLLASGIINTVSKNIYLAVIGKLFPPADLGFYSRADRLQQLPVSNMARIISRVTFPVFSSIQDNKPRLKKGTRKALIMLVMINFPMMIGLITVARPLVLVLLTDQWAPCIPYLQLLCGVGLLYPLHVINLNVLLAQGRSDLFFRLEVIKAILEIVMIAITYRWGIVVMICGQIIISCLSYFLNAYYTGKMLDYPITEQIKDLMPILALSIIMGFGVHAISYGPVTGHALLLIFQIIGGLILYAGLCYIFRIAVFMEFMEMARAKWLCCK